MATPPIPFTNLLSPAVPNDWLTTLLSNAVTLGLTVTSWQSGGVARTILSALAVSLSFEDGIASLIAQGGFLDYAATGTVTFTNADGTTRTVYVTPDPSIPAQNPTGALGWLDALVDSVYDIQRVLAQYAGGSEAFINTSANTYGPFAAGTYHVADQFTGATYNNVASLTIPPSTVVGTTISAVANDGGGGIQITTSTAHGLSSGAVVGIVGVTGISALTNPLAWYIDVIDATNFTLRGANFSGSYSGGGKVYLPTIGTVQADVIGSASGSKDSTGVVNVHTVTQSVTSLTGVSVDNLTGFTGSDIESNVALAARARLKLQSLSINGPKGAYAFAALSAQQLASAMALSISQAITREVEFVDKLTGFVTVFVANADGSPNNTDVQNVDAVVQAYSVPLGITAITKPATNHNIAAVADVWVPAPLNTSGTAAIFQNALQTYFKLLPIGGLSDPGGSYTHVVPYNDVLGAIYAAGAAAQIPIDDAQLTLNGSSFDISLAFSVTSAEVAVLSPVAPTVILHST